MDMCVWPNQFEQIGWFTSLDEIPEPYQTRCHILAAAAEPLRDPNKMQMLAKIAGVGRMIYFPKSTHDTGAAAKHYPRLSFRVYDTDAASYNNSIDGAIEFACQ